MLHVSQVCCRGLRARWVVPTSGNHRGCPRRPYTVNASSSDPDFTARRPRPDYVQAEMTGVEPKDVRDERRPQSQDEVAEAILDYAARGMARKDSDEIDAVLEGDAATVAENLMKEARTEMVETQRNEQGGVIRSSVEAKSQSVIDRTLDPNRSNPPAGEMVKEILKDGNLVAE